ncbi:MAG: phosphatase [Clostridiales bacterium]|nr:phosphatase [Clostridiales bacterium]
MRDQIDMHTHTLVSGHAYNTMAEMADAAARKGLRLLGITEHGPAMEGSCTRIYFRNLKAVDRSALAVPLMLGVELNILDFAGTVDLTDADMDCCDYAIASLHSLCIRPGTRAQNTGALIGAMRCPKVKVIGHPDDGCYPIDHAALVKAARERGVLIEINNASLAPGSFRRGARENDIALLAACRALGAPVLLSSDAHFVAAVGDHRYAQALLDEADFPQELVINRSAGLFRGLIGCA